MKQDSLLQGHIQDILMFKVALFNKKADNIRELTEKEFVLHSSSATHAEMEGVIQWLKEREEDHVEKKRQGLERRKDLVVLLDVVTYDHKALTLWTDFFQRYTWQGTIRHFFREMMKDVGRREEQVKYSTLDSRYPVLSNDDQLRSIAYKLKTNPDSLKDEEKTEIANYLLNDLEDQ